MGWRNLFPLGLLVGVVCAIGGCGAGSHQYKISVHNASSKPVMIGLAKEGGPYEDMWARPEDIATEIAARGPTPGVWEWGVRVLPGQTGDVGTVNARLDRGSQVFVRVYADAKSLDDFLAISRGSPNRADIPLVPGNNHFDVIDDGGRLRVQRRD
jgi:hypothetical protein